MIATTQRSGMDRKCSVREREPPTLAVRLKPYKSAAQQLRSVLRTLKENTTITFLPTPAMVLQTVRSQHVCKITFNSSCLYITDKSFQPKTINNVIPMMGNFIYMTSSKELTKLYVQDTSDLSAKIHMSAPDFSMDFTCACVHGQDIVRDNSNAISKVDLDHSVVCELIKWIAPHTRVKRVVKKQPGGVSSSANAVGRGDSGRVRGSSSGDGDGCPSVSGSCLLQILIHANPATIKFTMGDSSELEFTANSRVNFHEVKNTRFSIQAKNFYQALLNCAVTKLSCTVRILSEHNAMLCVSSKTNVFLLENFLSEEQTARGEISFDRSTSSGRTIRSSAANNGHAGNLNSVGGEDGGNDAEADGEDAQVVSKKHDRTGNRKGGDEHSSRDRYESQSQQSSQHKITSYMSAKSASCGGNPDRGSGYFGDAKEESDSDESVTFEFVSSAKKQKCCA